MENAIGLAAIVVGLSALERLVMAVYKSYAVYKSDTQQERGSLIRWMWYKLTWLLGYLAVLVILVSVLWEETRLIQGP